MKEKNFKFTVEITETLQRQVEVEARNPDEAEDKVREMYRNEEIVLDSEDYVDTEFSAISDYEPEQTLYYVELYDSTEDKSVIGVFKTHKSIQTIKKAYDQARENWYSEEGSVDCMFNYIQAALEKLNISFFLLEPDFTLNF